MAGFARRIGLDVARIGTLVVFSNPFNPDELLIKTRQVEYVIHWAGCLASLQQGKVALNDET